MTAAHVISHRSVPLSDLRLDAPLWVNPREFTGLDDKELAKLGESIKVKGINDPPKVQKILVNGDVMNLVIDGQRRVLAAREVLPKNAMIPVIDLEEEPCELTPDKADELMLKALTSLEREGLSSYELAKVAQRMKARGKTGGYIADAIGMSTTWVSKILKAVDAASPKLMLQWRKGEITDEQFKELAEIKDEGKQVEAAKEVIQARKDGDKGEARMRSKEIMETARAAEKPSKVTNGVNHANGVKAVVKGPQLSLLGEDKPTAPKKPAMPPRLVLEEMIGLADKKPPVSDYVKGIMDGVRYAAGLIDPDKFGKAWTQYIARIEGRPRPAKKSKAKAAKKPKVTAKAKAAPKKAKGKPKKKLELTSTGKR